MTSLNSLEAFSLNRNALLHALAIISSIRSATGEYASGPGYSRERSCALEIWHEHVFASGLSLSPLEQLAELRSHLVVNALTTKGILSQSTGFVPASAGHPETVVFKADIEFLASVPIENHKQNSVEPRHVSVVQRNLKLIGLIKNSSGVRISSLKELSKQIGITPNHLGKSFQEQVGLSLCDYLSAVRLSRAAWLLRYSNQPVVKISSQVGYSDASNFVRAFRSAYDKAPQMYRLGYVSRRALSPSIKDILKSEYVVKIFYCELIDRKSLILTIALPLKNG